MGMSIFQVAQFMREQATKVLIVGSTNWRVCPLWSTAIASPQNCSATPTGRSFIELTILHTAATGDETDKDVAEIARRAILQGDYQAVVCFPPDFAQRLAEFPRRVV